MATQREKLTALIAEYDQAIQAANMEAAIAYSNDDRKLAIDALNDLREARLLTERLLERAAQQ